MRYDVEDKCCGIAMRREELRFNGEEIRERTYDVPLERQHFNDKKI